MRTSFSFKSDETSPVAYTCGIDSLGFTDIVIYGRWIYKDFRSQSPSFHLAKIAEPSSICLTTSGEAKSSFFIDKLKSGVTKKYVGEIGARLNIAENRLIFLSNSLRENSVVEIFFEIETSKERDAELILAIGGYKDGNKVIKFEEAIVEYHIKSTTLRGILSDSPN